MRARTEKGGWADLGSGSDWAKGEGGGDSPGQGTPQTAARAVLTRYHGFHPRLGPLTQKGLSDFLAFPIPAQNYFELGFVFSSHP